MTGEELRAWLVHLYTGLGLVCAAAIAVLIVRGGDHEFRLAFFLMMVATLIDATDGWFARRARVKEVLPQFDGGALDNLIDFHTYTSLPLLLIWRADLLPGSLALVLLLPLLASGYGFSQTNAKTDDGFFLGFPSYWNIVALYLYVLQMPPWLCTLLLSGFALLTFVPTPYLYASRGGPFARVINYGAAVWFVMLAAMLASNGPISRTIGLVSLIYPVIYMTLSGVVTRRLRHRLSV
jgi:phosphatidylcholine synthase